MLKDYHSHICQILERLYKIGIQADVDKCEFYVEEIKFLGLIIFTNNI